MKKQRTKGGFLQLMIVSFSLPFYLCILASFSVSFAFCFCFTGNLCKILSFLLLEHCELLTNDRKNDKKNIQQKVRKEKKIFEIQKKAHRYTRCEINGVAPMAHFHRRLHEYHTETQLKLSIYISSNVKFFFLSLFLL